MTATELRFAVGEHGGEVSALLLRPTDAYCLLVLAHGAGAGMRQAFMEALAVHLWKRGAATLRYQFPYMETGRGGPSPPAPHTVEDADHSFRVLKRSGRSDTEVLDELADSFERWSAPLV